MCNILSNFNLIYHQAEGQDLNQSRQRIKKNAVNNATTPVKADKPQLGTCLNKIERLKENENCGWFWL